MRRIDRRTFLKLGALAVPALGAADAFLAEPNWVSVRTLKIGSNPSLRLVHVSDFHHTGDKGALRDVVGMINDIEADCVCFTGDIVEESRYLDGALTEIATIRHPVFGVPGNHDYWSAVPFGEIDHCLRQTSGRWLMDEVITLDDGSTKIIGLSGRPFESSLESEDELEVPEIPHDVESGEKKKIILCHYPVFADRLGNRRFDLLLAGHSHGGQVRLPFVGALIVPFAVGRYEQGLYDTRSGPLYVNPGIGVHAIRVRFLCRPEITVIDL